MKNLRYRVPKTQSLLQGVIVVLVLIIGYQVLDLHSTSCSNKDDLNSNHHGLPWAVQDEDVVNRKRFSVNTGLDEPKVSNEKNRNRTGIPYHKADKRKTTFVRNKGRKKSRPKCYKQIQIWSTEYTLWRQGEFSCPGLPCGIRQYTSTSYRTLQNSDAVLLWHETIWDWDELHRNRPQGQKWILTTNESPVNTRRSVIPPPQYSKNSYNYIMTYHTHESDFYASYGRYDTSKPSVNESRNWAAKKTHLVAWASRNCNNSYVKWKRTKFVRALSEMVNVDMYGKCGDKSCPRNEKVCDDILKKHKFYLSLENCNCRHYITEKFWKMAYSYDMIPVVYGPPREDYEAVAPPNSFIHVEDFNSLKELADYLDLLDMNDDRYNAYFAWKRHGSIQITPPDWLYQPEQMCQVVERLLEDEKAVADNTYTAPVMPDWDKWWFGSCKRLGDFPIIMN